MIVEKTQARESITRGFVGEALLMPEVNGANEIIAQFWAESVVLPHRAAEWLSKGGRAAFVAFGRVRTTLEISPGDGHTSAAEGTVITIGSHIYNAVTDANLDKFANLFEMKGKDAGVRRLLVKTGALAGQRFSVEQQAADGTSQKNDFGVLCRINYVDDKRRRRSVFICSGMGAAASYACAHHLAECWESLLRDCDTKEFVKLVWLPGQADRNTTKLVEAEYHYLYREAEAISK